MWSYKKSCEIFKNDFKGIWGGGLAFLAYSFIANTFLDRYCPLTLVSGLPCPACGMTRASVLLLKGHFIDALIMHPMVLSFFALFIAFCLFRYVLYIDTKLLINLLFFVIITGLLVYVLRMLYIFPDRAPMVFYSDNYISRLFSLF